MVGGEGRYSRRNSGRYGQALRAKLKATYSLCSEFEKGNEMSEWQPIETAPKDSTYILGYDNGMQCTVYWDSPGKYWSLVVCGSHAEDDKWTPTHWMPLPPLQDQFGEITKKENE